MIRHAYGMGIGTTVSVVAVVLILSSGLAGWAVALATIIAIVGLAWAIYDFARSRRMHDEYRAFAESHGWDYAERSLAFESRFASFPFGQGTTRRQESMLRGDFNGQRCATFAQVFELSADRESPSTVQAYQVTLAELPVALPRLDIVPENLPSTIAKALGGRDIDFESHEFNRRWRVRCDNARYAHAVIDPRMIERLLHSDVDGMAVRIEGGAVYVWRVGREGTSSLASRLGVVTGIARRIPEHVIREYADRGHHLRRDDAATRPLTGPAWALEPGALTSRRYTGIGVDADGDGIEDWKQLR